MSTTASPPRIVIPLYEGFNLLDLCGPAEMFSWAGYQVELMAEVPGEVTALNGFVLKVENPLPDPPQRCDALWVPGGNPAQLNRIIADPQSCYLRFLKDQSKASAWTCSVCEGALLLAAAGLLDGRTVTTHWAFIPDLLTYYSGDPHHLTVADGHPRFVIDGDRLTGGGISSGLDEALALIDRLSGPEQAQEVQRTTQYYPDPPVTSSIPAVISPSTSPPPGWSPPAHPTGVVSR